MHVSTADAEKANVQQVLDTKRDELVRNYVREQKKVYSELLPEVILQHAYMGLAVMQQCCICHRGLAAISS